MRTAKRQATMQAPAIVAPGRIELLEVGIPEPGPGEVRLRLEGSGLCASSLPLFEGRSWFEYPVAPGKPGHEGWGVVDAVGEGVDDLSPGDRVAALSEAAFAPYDIARADAVVRLPAALDGQPFPGEAFGCAANILRRSAIQPNETVAIVGIGFLGSVLTRLATRAGAHVIAIARRPTALALARRYGAALALLYDERWRVTEQVMAWTCGAGADCVIEVTGEQDPLDLAAELTRTRGRLVIAGYHQDGLRQVNMQLWNWRGIDVINAHERDPRLYVRGIREAVDAVVSHHLDPLPLFSHRFPLAKLGEAFTTLRERPQGFVKALVMAP